MTQAVTRHPSPLSFDTAESRGKLSSYTHICTCRHTCMCVHTHSKYTKSDTNVKKYVVHSDVTKVICLSKFLKCQKCWFRICTMAKECSLQDIRHLKFLFHCVCSNTSGYLYMHALVYVEVRRQPLGLVSREPFTLVF